MVSVEKGVHTREYWWLLIQSLLLLEGMLQGEVFSQRVTSIGLVKGTQPGWAISHRIVSQYLLRLGVLSLSISRRVSHPPFYKQRGFKKVDRQFNGIIRPSLCFSSSMFKDQQIREHISLHHKVNLVGDDICVVYGLSGLCTRYI